MGQVLITRRRSVLTMKSAYVHPLVCLGDRPLSYNALHGRRACCRRDDDHLVGAVGASAAAASDLAIVPHWDKGSVLWVPGLVPHIFVPHIFDAPGGQGYVVEVAVMAAVPKQPGIDCSPLPIGVAIAW
jgi:hypothetical protein